MENLTDAERLIFERLTEGHGKCVSQDALRAAAGGITEGSLWVLIRRLRSKLSQETRIRTIWRGGYILERVPNGQTD